MPRGGRATATAEAAGLIVFMSVLLLGSCVRCRRPSGLGIGARRRVGLGCGPRRGVAVLAQAPAREGEEHVVERGLAVGGRHDVEAGVAELADPAGEGAVAAGRGDGDDRPPSTTPPMRAAAAAASVAVVERRASRGRRRATP